MPWSTLDEAAAAKRMSVRHLLRLVQKNKVKNRKNGDGTTQIWIEEASVPPPYLQGEGRLSAVCLADGGVVIIPDVPPCKLTDEIMHRVNIMLRSIAATPSPSLQGESRGGVMAVEQSLDDEVPAGTQRRWKADLRELYGLPPRSDLSQLVDHPQIKQALAYVIIRKSPKDAGEMRSAKNLLIVSPTNGQIFSLEEFLRALYAHKNHNARSCYRALVDAAAEKRLLFDPSHEPASLEDVPSEGSVRRWFRGQGKQSRPLRRSRMDRSERIADRFYISRPDDEYRPGGKLQGDHTEDVTLVYREDGKVAPLWTTSLVDVRTFLCKAYVHSYRPNSDTIALAYRNAVLGTQLEVYTEEGYKPLNLIDAPDLVVYDNGKDYRSKFSGQVIGKVDFNDRARRTVQMISEIHYTGKRLPQAKGTVETWFRVVQRILKYLPGYKGSNYSQKPDELRHQVKAGILLTEEQYKALFKAAVNTLNNRPMRRLGGLSPIQFYLTHQQQLRHVDERVLNFLMMKAPTNDGTREIKRGYVRMMCEEYFSADLDEHHGKRCTLYYDPKDMGRVAVYLGEEFATFAVNKKLLGTTERQLLRLMKLRMQQNKEDAEEIRAMRAGITSEDAKAILFSAETANVAAVNRELLQKRTPTVITLTGIESRAKELHERLERQKRNEEVQTKRDDAKNTPITLINTQKLR